MFKKFIRIFLLVINHPIEHNCLFNGALNTLASKIVVLNKNIHPCNLEQSTLL